LGQNIRHKTRTIKKTLNPKWNEQFKLLAKDENDILSIKLFDDDYYIYDNELLGELELNLITFLFNDGRWIPLTERTEIGFRVGKGDIKLEFFVERVPLQILSESYSNPFSQEESNCLPLYIPEQRGSMDQRGQMALQDSVEINRLVIHNRSSQQQLELTHQELSQVKLELETMKIKFAKQNNENECLRQQEEIHSGRNLNNLKLPQLYQVCEDLKTGTRKVEKRIEELRKLEEDEKKCVICLEKTKTVSLVPCGHRVICELCAQASQHMLKQCPVCRATVIATLRIWD